MSEEQIVTEQTMDVNELHASLTASKVLVAILETLGSVKVPTLTLFNATNKDKQMIVDYDDSEQPSFVFRLPTTEEMEYNAELINESDNDN
jgi:hypothetical protein